MSRQPLLSACQLPHSGGHGDQTRIRRSSALRQGEAQQYQQPCREQNGHPLPVPPAALLSCHSFHLSVSTGSISSAMGTPSAAAAVSIPSLKLNILAACRAIFRASQSHSSSYNLMERAVRSLYSSYAAFQSGERAAKISLWITIDSLLIIVICLSSASPISRQGRQPQEAGCVAWTAGRYTTPHF